jgi:1,4-alpha-glucan branching enzyme
VELLEGTKDMGNEMLKVNELERPNPAGQILPTKAAEGRPVKFIFPAVRAHSVSVAGTFNNWTPGVLTLKRDLTGLWRGAIYLKPGTYQYRYSVDGRWMDDPTARKTVPNEFGGKDSVLEVK